jgi:hypothetical protein
MLSGKAACPFVALAHRVVPAKTYGVISIATPWRLILAGLEKALVKYQG